MRDEAIVIEALNEASQIIAENLEPGPRDAKATSSADPDAGRRAIRSGCEATRTGWVTGGENILSQIGNSFFVPRMEQPI
jgi:hypothetical protein